MLFQAHDVSKSIAAGAFLRSHTGGACSVPRPPSRIQGSVPGKGKGKKKGEKDKEMGVE